MKITPLTSAFAEVLARLHAEAFGQHGGQQHGGQHGGWNAQSIASTLATAGTFGLLASREDEPLGFILMRFVTFRKGGGETEVLTLATLPAQRRSGVARALMHAACTHAQKAGVQKAFLEVATDNAPARALYEGLGFKPAGRRKAYYDRPSGVSVDALVMVKALTD